MKTKIVSISMLILPDRIKLVNAWIKENGWEKFCEQVTKRIKEYSILHIEYDTSDNS